MRKKWPETYLQALDYHSIDRDWPLYPRLLVWLAHLNRNNRVSLSDSEIEALAGALEELIAKIIYRI